MDMEKSYQWAKALCYYAGEDEDFLNDFWHALTQSEPIYRELHIILNIRSFCANIKWQGTVW